MKIELNLGAAVLACVAVMACHAGVTQDMKPLFAREADEIFAGNCLNLALSAADGDLGKMDQLLRDKELVNCKGYYETTPLYWVVAAKKTSLKGAEHLLKAGANPNQYIQSGEAIIHFASMRGDVNILRTLLKYGANPNLEDKKSHKTPLFYIEPGGFLVVPLLLSSGADVNHRSINGGTAMMTLAATRQFRAIDEMLNAGADWKLENRAGDSLPAIVKRIESTWDKTSDEYAYYLKVREFLGSRGARL